MDRAELTPLMPGDPRMDALPKGTCEFSRRGDGRLYVDRADPRILVSAEMIEAVASGRVHPDAEVTGLNYTAPNGHVGALLRICGSNRTVIYRLTEYAECCLGYVAEWPD